MTQMIGEFPETGIRSLPDDWILVKVRDVAEKPQYGYTTSATKENTGIKFLRITDITDSGVLWSTVPFAECPAEKTDQFLLQKDDIVFARTGATTGKSYLIVDCPKAIFASYLIRLRINERCIPRFVYYYFNTNSYWNQISRTKTGATQPGINGSKLQDLVLPLPPLDEQRRIAAVLTAIQDAIAAQEDVIAAARAFKRSLMHRLFTYGPGRVPAETKETLFGDVPQMWDSCPLSECATVQTGTTKGRRFKPEDDVVSVPYLRVANVQDGYLDLSEIKEIKVKRQDIDRFRLKVGDVLMTEGGDFDKLGRGFIWQGEIENCLHQNHVFAVRPHRKMLRPDYLAYLVQSPYGKNYFLSVAHRTTNLASINSTKLKALPVLLPDLSKQAEIVDMMTTIDTKIAAEEDRKAALDALFKSMLHQLMTGQIRLLSDEGLPSVMGNL